MKNKKVIYVLIPLVIVVWGFIGYRIFVLLKQKDTSSFQHHPEKLQPQEKEIIDTFYLIADYPDPFLKSNTGYRTNKTSKSRNSQKKNQKKKNIRWPNIEYKGLIKNQKTEKIVINIKINNKNMLMSEGEEMEQVMLLKIFNDSIITEFFTEKRTILKQ